MDRGSNHATDDWGGHQLHNIRISATAANPSNCDDLSDVEMIDGAGLGALVSIAVTAQASECSIKLAAPDDFICRVFTITNLTSVFQAYSTVDAATLAFHGQAA